MRSSKSTLRTSFVRTTVSWSLCAVAIAALLACGAETQSAPPDVSEPMAPLPNAGIVADTEIPADVDSASWARLPLPQREALDADGQRVYDLIVNPESRYATGPRGPVAMWLYSPPMADLAFQTGTLLRYTTQRDQRQTELAILTTAREIRSQYEWTAHEPLALAAGLEPEIIELVKQRGELEVELPGLGEMERAIIRLTREICSAEKVSQQTYQQALGLFGERGLLELAGLVGYYQFVNATLKTFDLQVAAGRERLLPDLWQ